MKSFSFVICLLLVVTCLTAQHNNNNLTNEFDRLLNKPFAALELEDENGNIFNTASLKGKTIYVDYWFTQCAPCLAQQPYAKALKSFFNNDTGIVFLNICIEAKERKQAWKQMIKEKEIGGIHLFYAKNQPQKINLLREYKVEQFPVYMVVNNNFNIIGYNAPRPSERGLVEWSIYQASKNIKVSDALRSFTKKTKECRDFLQTLPALH